MSNTLERLLLLGVVLLSFICVWRASAQTPVTVHKVYHHSAADMNSIELGSCVVYGKGFSKEPVTTKTRVMQDTEQHTFIIPRASVHDAQCQRAIQTINNDASQAGYQLTIQERKRPDTALEVTFTFPKDRCFVAYKCIDSIQHEKGIAFNVYNKSLVHTLKKQNVPVIRTVSLHNPPVICVDPGHGGIDTGAVSATGISEKEVCLSVSREVQATLADMGYMVYLSRMDDYDVGLDERTRIAHERHADLVVSIHANAAPSVQASGAEIFFLDPNFSKNLCGCTGDQLQNLEGYMKTRTVHNRLLAESIHKALMNAAPQYNGAFKDRGVKTAVSQLLLGAFAPASLIELGFLTNPQESQLLADKKYQSLLARAIALGIHSYCLNMQV